MTTDTLTAEQEIADELQRLSEPFPAGFKHFLRHYVYIEDRKFGEDSASTIKWQWWTVHDEMIEDLQQRLLIILKARQVSWSWLLAAYRLYNALSQTNYFYMIISQGQTEADEALRKSHFIYDHLPSWLQPGLLTDNKSEMIIAGTNGTLQAFPSTPKAGRSFTANCIEADEAAHHEYAEENYTAYSPAIDAGGQHFIISTANGYGNLFERMYHAATRGLSGYKAKFYNWRVRPGRDDAWYEERKQNLTAAGQADKITQEYPETADEAFLASGRPRFSVQGMLAGEARICKPLDSIPPALLNIPGLQLWKLPIPGHPYVAFSDPAEGLEHGDASVTQILHARTLEHVASIHGRWEPAVFAQYSVQLVEYYNNALYGWERNNHGHVLTRVIVDELRYSRVYKHQERPTQQQRDAGTEPTAREGFPTNSETRGPLIDDLAQVIDTMALTSYSRDFWDECRKFVIDSKGKAAATKGACDDEVMAMAGARRMAMQPGAQSMRDQGAPVKAPSLYNRR